MIRVINDLRECRALLGIVRAEPIAVHDTVPGFDRDLAELITLRQEPLTDQEETLRVAVRGMLRNGQYRPTGRGKPASEYLLRAATEDVGRAFPRINTPVDACNYVSLKYLLPVSIWDLDLAGSSTFVFRLGAPEEQYVFNTADQIIDVQDLIVGCRVRPDGPDNGEAVISPVKDSLATKTTDDTRRVAGCVYAPADQVSGPEMERICGEFVALLAGNGAGQDTAYAVIPPGDDRLV